VLYQLPDGTKWAEHGNFYDCEDLVSVQNTMPILFGICSSLYALHCALCCPGNLHALLVSQDKDIYTGNGTVPAMLDNFLLGFSDIT